ncbi:unnamed protein product, partial [Meganyctiphanes norvegica]
MSAVMVERPGVMRVEHPGSWWNARMSRGTFGCHTGTSGSHGGTYVCMFKNSELFCKHFPQVLYKITKQVGGVKRMNNSLDGDKWVCFDKGFKSNDCVVYSFGINNEWSFDDDMDKRHHCQVGNFVSKANLG